MGFWNTVGGALPGIAQAGLGVATANPWLIASGAAQGIGGAMAMNGTRQVQTGPTDEEIARFLAASRRAQSAQIADRERAGSRQAASRAAMGGTLESGLAGRAFQGVAGQAGMERAMMEAGLAQSGIQAKSMQGWRPDVTRLGAIGMGLQQIASPVQQLGMNILTQKFLPQQGSAQGQGSKASGAGASQSSSGAGVSPSSAQASSTGAPASVSQPLESSSTAMGPMQPQWYGEAPSDFMGPQRPEWARPIETTTTMPWWQGGGDTVTPTAQERSMGWRGVPYAPAWDVAPSAAYSSPWAPPLRGPLGRSPSRY